MQELLAALAQLKDTQLIFTLPNADTDGRAIIEVNRRQGMITRGGTQGLAPL